MLGGGDVAQEVCARARADGTTNGSGDVVVAYADIGDERPQHVEGGVMA